jgi:hypothetical protein
MKARIHGYTRRIEVVTGGIAAMKACRSNLGTPTSRRVLKRIKGGIAASAMLRLMGLFSRRPNVR